MAVELRDVADGLWLWRQPPLRLEEGNDWQPEVSSFVVESRGARSCSTRSPRPRRRRAVAAARRLAPDAIVILKPDHVRDVDLFARWYDADTYGPMLFWPDDVPHRELEPIDPGLRAARRARRPVRRPRLRARRRSTCPSSARSCSPTG